MQALTCDVGVLLISSLLRAGWWGRLEGKLFFLRDGNAAREPDGKTLPVEYSCRSTVWIGYWNGEDS